MIRSRQLPFSAFTSRAIAVAAIACLLSACASGPQIPVEERHNYALVVPKMHNSIIIKLNGERIEAGFQIAGKPLNFRPALSTFTLNVCTNGTNCNHVDFTLQTKAGFAYVLKDRDTVEVYDRSGFDFIKIKGNLVEVLVKASGNLFVTKAEYAAIREEQIRRDTALDVSHAQRQNQEFQRRTNNAPLIRKIGTRVCQNGPGDVVYIGFVEGLAEEKVQIRIAQAFIKPYRNLVPQGFAPSIIWDWPRNWELCEA